MKIVFVGAFPPQEKGEAQYLGRYVDEYRKLHGDVPVISQYVETPCRDSWNGIEVNRAIADRSLVGMSYAPQRELVEAVLKSGADLMHLHYGPNADYGGRLGESLVGALQALRRRNVRTVITLHSLWFPRDVEAQARRLRLPSFACAAAVAYFGWFQRRLMRAADRTLALVSDENSPVTSEYAKAYGLGNLGEEVHACEPRFENDVRQNGTDDPMFFAFGFLRPDKGFEVLLKAFHQHVNAGGRGRLLISGRPQSESDEAYARSLEAIASEIPRDRCLIERRFISDQELEQRLKTCDVVVIPYLRNVGASGPLHHALGVGKPVIASRVGHNAALASTVRIVEPNDIDDLAHALSDLSSPAEQSIWGDRSKATAVQRSWTRLVESHHRLYRSLLP